MKVNTLKYSQILPISLDRAWNFLSSPKNLKLITPKSMNFNITEWDNRDSYPGQIIQYTVEPIFGIKLKWVTEITHLKKNKYFLINHYIFSYFKLIYKIIIYISLII